MARFQPPFCPNAACPSRDESQPFTYVRRGHYHRRCDRRCVPRFRCRSCARGFSSQTFRLDFRQRKPWINQPLAQLLCAKTTLRKSAEILGVRRPTVERRLELFGRHAEQFHRACLKRHHQLVGGVTGTFQIDELETFEQDRRQKPLTVPVLIERSSLFVVHVEAAPLPPRRRSSTSRSKKVPLPSAGLRPSGSNQAVEHSFRAWRKVVDPTSTIRLQSDRKSAYCSLLRKVFGSTPVTHERYSGKAARTYFNPLFPINHTNAMLRDTLSRLVRRSWGASKLRRKLERHLWLFVVFRNYVRGITRRDWETTPAMALSVVDRKLDWTEILRWKAAVVAFHHDHG